jgi:hypothetical protein
MNNKKEVLENIGKLPSVSNHLPSDKTMREMAEFFAKTSVPRIIAKSKKYKRVSI